jgi:hypothetical protein
MKFTLEQVTKAQRGSRGIALLFLWPRRYMRVCGQRQAPTAGPRVGLDGCGTSRPLPGFDPRTVQPVTSRYTAWTILAQYNWKRIPNDHSVHESTPTQNVFISLISWRSTRHLKFIKMGEKLGTLTLSFSKMITQRFTPIRSHERRQIMRQEEDYLSDEQQV